MVEDKDVRGVRGEEVGVGGCKGSKMRWVEDKDVRGVR